MTRSSRYRSRLLTAAAAALFSQAAAAQTPSVPLLERSRELRLAASAGPLTVSRGADVYLFGPQGFARAITGTNGWSCLVAREAGVPDLLAPQCLNPHATRTVLPAMLLEGRLQAQGLDSAAITAELTRQWGTGELPTPEGPAYAYMLSAGQRLGRAGQFKPHFMLFVPGVTAALAGVDPKKPQFALVGPRPGSPLATVVILMDEFVDPADVVLPAR